MKTEYLLIIIGLLVILLCEIKVRQIHQNAVYHLERMGTIHPRPR